MGGERLHSWEKRKTVWCFIHMHKEHIAVVYFWVEEEEEEQPFSQPIFVHCSGRVIFAFTKIFYIKVLLAKTNQSRKVVLNTRVHNMHTNI